MVKNWLILGDEAFNSDDYPIGLMRFSLEEMKSIIGKKQMFIHMV